MIPLQDVLNKLPADRRAYVNDGMDVSSVGDEMWDSLTDELRRGCTFIARIYPDRIEGREG